MSKQNHRSEKALRRHDRIIRKRAYDLISPKIKAQEPLSQLIRRVKYELKKKGLLPRVMKGTP